jgi:hypothetical protein
MHPQKKNNFKVKEATSPHELTDALIKAYIYTCPYDLLPDGAEHE